jgi:hypothetical protein
MATARRVPDLLRKLQTALHAQAEVFGELVTVLASAGPDAASFAADGQTLEHDSDARYLSVTQLATRIPYAPHTIRNLMSAGELVEGTHYFKRRGRVMFSWPAMRAWVEQQTTQALDVEPLPLVRNRKNGRS